MKTVIALKSSIIGTVGFETNRVFAMTNMAQITIIGHSAAGKRSNMPPNAGPIAVEAMKRKRAQ